MKKLQKQWLKACNWVLGGLLILLGFSGCSDPLEEEDTGDIRLMYGVMPVMYGVKGKVIDANTQRGVPGIRVLSGTLYENEDKELFTYYLDTIYTNAKGEFETRYYHSYVDKQRFIWEDVDGEANGSYRKDSIDVSVKGKKNVEVTLKIKKKTSE